MSSSFGILFRVTTFGESHGKQVGAVVDGCPPRLPLSATDIQPQLDRRRPGQSELSTPRDEADLVQIVSGVENGVTLGTPIAMLVANRDQRPADYSQLDKVGGRGLPAPELRDRDRRLGRGRGRGDRQWHRPRHGHARRGGCPTGTLPRQGEGGGHDRGHHRCPRR